MRVPVDILVLTVRYFYVNSKQTRLRREYLYRKSLEEKDRDTYEKKKRIREALADGKPIPTELRQAETEVRRSMQLEAGDDSAPHTHIDDEYGTAGTFDPKIVVTSSRDPSSRLTQFVKVRRPRKEIYNDV